jgi:hypothetical protein
LIAVLVSPFLHEKIVLFRGIDDYGRPFLFPDAGAFFGEFCSPLRSSCESRNALNLTVFWRTASAFASYSAHAFCPSPSFFSFFLKFASARSCAVLVLIAKRVPPDKIRYTDAGRPSETEASFTGIWGCGNANAKPP